jgi:hypothetical protein
MFASKLYTFHQHVLHFCVALSSTVDTLGLFPYRAVFIVNERTVVGRPHKTSDTKTNPRQSTSWADLSGFGIP